ncbi:hypothetical protein SUGI_1130950, partial [Cryptomeria japonica]
TWQPEKPGKGIQRRGNQRHDTMSMASTTVFVDTRNKRVCNHFDQFFDSVAFLQIVVNLVTYFNEIQDELFLCLYRACLLQLSPRHVRYNVDGVYNCLLTQEIKGFATISSRFHDDWMLTCGCRLIYVCI